VARRCKSSLYRLSRGLRDRPGIIFKEIPRFAYKELPRGRRERGEENQERNWEEGTFPELRRSRETLPRVSLVESEIIISRQRIARIRGIARNPRKRPSEFPFSRSISFGLTILSSYPNYRVANHLALFYSRARKKARHYGTLLGNSLAPCISLSLFFPLVPLS